MTTTSTRIVFGLFDLAVKLDSTPSSADDWSKTDISTLTTGNMPRLPWATWEPDFWLLDGNYKFYETTETNSAFISNDVSDENGDFSSPPVLTIDFGAAYSADALTLRFSPFTGDYANDIHIAWNDGGGLIQEADYTPDAAVYTVAEPVADFTQIVITFNATNKPYRRVRLDAIDYGAVIEFDNTSIRSARITEEVDPVGGELRSNSLEFTLYSDDPDFNAMEPDFLPSERQPIFVYQTIDGYEVFMGMFFLDEWKTVSETQVEFYCVDLIGLMDKMPYRGAFLNSALNVILPALLEPLGIAFFIEDSVSSVCQGWTASGTLRDVLHQIAMTGTNRADCSRGTTIRFNNAPAAPVYPLDPVYAQGLVTLTDADMGQDIVLVLLPAVLEIIVDGHTYTPSAPQQTLFSATLAVGTYEIEFDHVVQNLSITGGTITEYYPSYGTSIGTRYAIISVAAPGAVVVKGYPLEDAVQPYPLTSNADSSEKVLRVSGAGLISPLSLAFNGNVSVRARLQDYYQNYRYQHNTSLYASYIEPGQLVLVDSWSGYQIFGIVTKIETDLTRGMVSTVEIIGSKVE